MFTLPMLSRFNHRGKDNMDQLGKIVAILGTADLHAYISRAKIEVTPEIRRVIAKYTMKGGSKQEWKGLVPADDKRNEDQSYSPSEDGLDLLSKILIYDDSIRLTAKQAMSHPFFDSVRDRVDRQIREKLRTLRET